MYYLLGTLIVLFCLLALIHWWRKKKNLCRLACMTACEKYELLDSLVEPFGYNYNPEWDVFTSRRDAWQRQFGYGTVYDRAAPFFNMVLDTIPVYFNYGEKTWLIQIWKGQYGISSGCETGIYYADHIVPEHEREKTIFHAVEDPDMMILSSELWGKGKRIASLSDRHWWLTAFAVGSFSKPSQLSLDVSIQFPDFEMKDAFYEALLASGIDRHDIFSHYKTVYFHVPDCFPKISWWGRLHGCIAQCINRLICKLFNFATRCCSSRCDRILYLYFYLPFLCRRMLHLKHFRKKRKRRLL